jgi:hypothetical protein
MFQMKGNIEELPLGGQKLEKDTAPLMGDAKPAWV